MRRPILVTSAVIGLALLHAGSVLAQDAMAPASQDPDKVVDTITFGSCAAESAEQPIWGAINGHGSDVWIWLGDNVYGDTEDMEVLQAKWDMLAAQPGYQDLLASETDVVAIWDITTTARTTPAPSSP